MHPHGPSPDTASIISTVLEGVLYGFSVFMYGITIRVLVHGKRLREINPRCVTVATSLLILSTAHLAFGVGRLIDGLVKNGNDTQAQQALFFANIRQWGFVGKTALYVLETMLADMILMYRCYTVWQSAWVIAMPVYLWLSIGVSGFGSVYEMAHETQDPNNIFASDAVSWILAFIFEALIANALSTGLLAYRIWIVARASARYSATEASQSILAPLPRIIVDSGLLYSATLCATLICFLTQNWAYYILLDLISPIISITFYMVLIRVEFSRQRSSDGTDSDPERSNNALEFHKDTVISRDHPPYPMQTRIRAADLKSDLDLTISPNRSLVSFSVLQSITPPSTLSRASIRPPGRTASINQERPRSHPSTLSPGDADFGIGCSRSPTQRHVQLALSRSGHSRSRIHLDVPTSPASFAISFQPSLAPSPSPAPSLAPSLVYTPPSPNMELPYASRLSLPESPTWFSHPEGALDSPDLEWNLVEKRLLDR